MDTRILETIVKDAEDRFAPRGASQLFDAYQDPAAALPAIMRDAGRAEVLKFFVDRLTGVVDVRFEEAANDGPEAPQSVDEYLLNPR